MDNPQTEETISAAIGDSKETLIRPAGEEIAACLRYVAKVLPIDDSDVTTLTQLNHPLLSAWVHAAGDLDRHVVEWVKGGTPAGIEKHAEQCGIFPPASNHEAAMQRTLQE